MNPMTTASKKKPLEEVLKILAEQPSVRPIERYRDFWIGRMISARSIYWEGDFVGKVTYLDSRLIVVIQSETDYVLVDLYDGAQFFQPYENDKDSAPAPVDRFRGLQDLTEYGRTGRYPEATNAT